MPNSNDVSSNAKATDDKKTLSNKQKKVKSDDKDQPKVVPADDQKPPDAASTVGQAPKEKEPAESADQQIHEIQERSKEADKQAEIEVQEALGEEARLKEPQIEIPPDVADARVVSPEKEASEALQKDTTVELPVTKEEYEKGEHTKLSAKVTVKKEVFGIASIIGLTLFVGRLIKLVHHHAKKFVFRKEGNRSVGQ